MSSLTDSDGEDGEEAPDNFIEDSQEEDGSGSGNEEEQEEK